MSNILKPPLTHLSTNGKTYYAHAVAVPLANGSVSLAYWFAEKPSINVLSKALTWLNIREGKSGFPYFERLSEATRNNSAEKTIATLFSGFGGVDIGAMAAGLRPLWGVEYDAEIAAVANLNLGGHIVVADVLNCNPADFERPDVLHASPPCTRASVANQSAETDEEGSKESELDLALAAKVIEFIEVLKPSTFTLENVYGYRNFKAFRNILIALRVGGYTFDYWFLNTADYGVPQTRKRLILVARLGKHKITKPAPTHCGPAKVDGNQMSMFEMPPAWVGWLAAIEDLLPTLPDSQFAQWQMDRLPAELKEMIMLWNMDQTAHNVTTRAADMPVPTVDTGMMRRPSSIPRAILVGGANTSKTQAAPLVGCSSEVEPTLCVNSTNSQHWRAFVVEGSAAGVDNPYTLPIRAEDEPIFTMRAGQNNPRAFLMGKNQDKFGDGLRQSFEQAQTIGANEHGSKAFVVDCKNSGNFGKPPTTCDADEPMFTIGASQAKGMPRAAVAGRVVAMTPRCLARFQSFPDWYELPESHTLAAKGIGNAVPPLLMQKIYERITR